MSLQIKLIFTSGLLLLLTIALTITVNFVENEVTNTTNEQLTINNVVSEILELDAQTDTLVDEYNQADAIKWQQTYTKIEEHFTEGEFDEKEEVATSQKILTDLSEVNKAMNELAALSNQSSTSATMKETIVTKLELQIQTSLSESFKLQELVNNFLLEKQNSARTTIIILLTTLALAIIGASVYLSLSISKPINGLKGVIEDISRGKLDTHIDSRILEKKDEIGALARAFDRTIVSLKLAMRDNKETVQHETEVKKNENT